MGPTSSPRSTSPIGTTSSTTWAGSGTCSTSITTPRSPRRTSHAIPLLSPWPAGLRVPGCWDPFEAGVRAILGQQVSVAGATGTAGRVVDAHGTPVEGLSQLGLSAAFPRAEQLVDADLPIPRQRADAVRAFAAAHLSGRLALDGSLALDDFASAMCALPGVGPWTAHYLALRLGDPDAFPANDLHVLRRAGDVDTDRWRPWRAYATLRLWTL